MYIEHKEYLALLNQVEFLKQEMMVLKKDNTILAQQLYRQSQKSNQLQMMHEQKVTKIQQLHQQALLQQQQNTRRIMQKLDQLESQRRVSIVEKENKTPSFFGSEKTLQTRRKDELKQIMTAFANLINNDPIQKKKQQNMNQIMKLMGELAGSKREIEKPSQRYLPVNQSSTNTNNKPIENNTKSTTNTNNNNNSNNNNTSNNNANNDNTTSKRSPGTSKNNIPKNESSSTTNKNLTKNKIPEGTADAGQYGKNQQRNTPLEQF